MALEPFKVGTGLSVEPTTTSVTANTETTVATFTTASAKAAEFHVKVGQGNRLYSTKVLVLQNGTTADFTKYGDLAVTATENIAGTFGNTWTTRTSNFGATDIRSVAYGNSLWVAGGFEGQLRTSTDAITWTTRTSNFGNTGIRSVAYGNALWVAGGDTGQLRTSTDGTTWTTRTSNFSASAIRSVAYGNSLWVTGGEYGQLRTSTDAITWTTRTSNFGNYGINSVAYGNNIWIIGGYGGRIRTSTDAITWVTRTTNLYSFEGIHSVAYGNTYVAAGGNFSTRKLIISTDSINWSTPSFFNTGGGGYSGEQIYSVAYGDGLWVAGTGSGGVAARLFTSTDAITWTTRTSNFSATDIRSVAYGNSILVAGGEAGQLRTSALDAAAYYVGGLTSSASVTFNTDISGSDVRLRMTIPDAATTNATVKVLTTTMGES